MNFSPVTSVAFLLVLLAHDSLQWQNGYDGWLDAQCSGGQGFRRVRSQYNGGARDRVWQWDCHEVVSSSQGWDECYWTGYLNWFDQPVYFQCDPFYVLAGVQSYHANWAEDRRWKARCCRETNYFTRNCQVSGLINGWQGWMDYSVEAPRVFTGMFHAHRNSPEDRRWGIETCEYYHCSGGLQCESIDDACEHITNPGTDGTFTCSCYDGYKLASNGRSCIDIDECAVDNGYCTHTCVNIPGSYHCFCDDGFDLHNDSVTCNDIDECEYDFAHACGHYCTNTNGSYECWCEEGFDLGDNNHTCIDINECEWENGNCQQICDNQPGTYNCSCWPGYWLSEDGKSCIDINECDTNNGACEHTCENTIGSYNCYCDPGYQLRNIFCVDVNECQHNGGNCDHTCTNTNGSYTCSCNAGYQLSTDGRSCIDIDECSVNNGGCEHNCTNTDGSFACSCMVGYDLERGMFCTAIIPDEVSQELGITDHEVKLVIVVPVAVVVCLVLVILAVVITVIVMKKKIKDAGKAMIYHDHGVRGLYPEGAGIDPPLNKFDADAVSMNSLKKVLEEHAANYDED